MHLSQYSLPIRAVFEHFREHRGIDTRVRQRDCLTIPEKVSYPIVARRKIQTDATGYPTYTRKNQSLIRHSPTADIQHFALESAQGSPDSVQQQTNIPIAVQG